MGGAGDPSVAIGLLFVAALLIMGFVLTFTVRRSRELRRKFELAEANFDALFDRPDDSVVLCDRNGAVLALNSMARRGLETTPPTIADIPGFGKAAAERLADIWSNGHPLRWEMELPERRTLDVFARPIPDSRGQVARVLVSARDITGRMAPREHEECYQAVFDQARTGMALFDLEGRPVRVNRHLAAIAGLDPDDRPDDRAAFRGLPLAHPDAAADGSDVCWTRPDGRVVWVSLATSEVRDISGAPAFRLVAVNDITAHKETERQLVEAKEAAERASVAKTRFLAAASHDLRQPLQAVTMFTNVLANRVQDKTQKEIVGKIEASLEALRELLNALVDISKLEAGLFTPKVTEVSIGDVLDRLAEEFTPLAEAKGLRLHGVRTRRHVRTDPVLIERLLRNLLSNAVRYTEAGKIVLGCRRQGNAVRIQVLDTGIGIPADQHAAIFREFHQIGNDARDRRKGLGLGLAIVDRLGRLLDHPVTVRSTLGKGSTFEVLVPVGDEPATRSHAAPVPGRHLVRPALVAVIEDDPDVLLSMRLALEEVGHRVAAAPSAEECLGRLDRAPDAIVADYRLHDGKTGTEAIRLLQARFGLAIPGLLVTGETCPERLQTARDGGFDILHKPVRPEDLRSALDEMLHSGAQEGSHRG